MRSLTLILVCLLTAYLPRSQAADPTLPSASTLSSASQSSSSNIETTPKENASSPSSLSGASLQTVVFVRLKNVLKKGQTFSDCLARLTSSHYKSSPSSSGGTRRMLASKGVQDMLSSFSTQYEGSIPELDETTSDVVSVQGISTCHYQSTSFSHGSNEFFNIESSSASIFPGSVLQSKYIDGVQSGSQSQVPVPTSTMMKSATIKIVEHGSGAVYTVPYNGAGISRSISDIIAARSTNQTQPVYFEMGTSNDLAYFATKLGFNGNLQKKLGLSYSKTATSPSFKKKILFFFFKPVATFEVFINSTDPTANSPLNVFFTDVLTQSEVIRRTNTWWNFGNPPIYIDKVTYGSSIILTVDYTNTTGPLYEKINSGSSDMTTEEIQFNLNKIILSPTLKVLTIGTVSPAELAAIKSGNWADYIIHVPYSPSNKASIPITYTVKDFNQVNYNSTVLFDYMKVNCADGTDNNGQNKATSINTAKISPVGNAQPSDSAATGKSNYSSGISPSTPIPLANSPTYVPTPPPSTNTTNNIPTPIPILPASASNNNNGGIVPIKVVNTVNQTADISPPQYKTANSGSTNSANSVSNRPSATTPVIQPLISSALHSNPQPTPLVSQPDVAVASYVSINPSDSSKVILTKPNILLVLSGVLPYAPVNVYIFDINQTLIDKMTTKEETNTIGLNPYFTGPPIIVDIRTTGGRKNESSVLEGQVKITFIVDGSELPKGNATCRGNFCAERTVAVFTVNPLIPVVLP